MSTVRTFGAVKGAGVQVRIQPGSRPIESGPLGSTLIVGAFRSGPVGRVVSHTEGAGHYSRVRGGLVQGHDAPLAASHFYELSQGAGTLHTLRVTDGTERAASLALYDRDVELGVRQRHPAAKVAQVVATVDAHNGGRWAGRRALRSGALADVGAAIDGSTIDLGIEALADEWAGAALTLPGTDGQTYQVTGNTAEGVITIAGTFSAEALAAGAGAWALELENVHERTATPEAVAVEIADSGELEAGFSLYVHRDGAQVKAWPDLELDAAGDRYWISELTAEDADNFEIAPSSDFAGDASDPYKRPANLAEIPAPEGVSGSSVTLQIVRWTLDAAGAADPYLDTRHDVTWGADPRPAVIVLTFDGAGGYSVAATYLEGGQAAADLPDGALDSAWTSPVPWLPSFTVRSGDTAPAEGDTLTIYARPLPRDLASLGGWLYLAAGPDDGDTRARYRVITNDHQTVTLAPSVALEDLITPPGPAALEGTIAGPYDLSGVGPFEVVATVGDGDPITVAASLNGAAVTAEALAADLTAAEVTRAGSEADALIAFRATADGHLVVETAQDFGAGAALTLGAGSLNAIAGWEDAAEASGVTPTRIRLQWRQELSGGYDGLVGLASEHYQTAWTGGALDELRAENTGAIRAAMPGVTDADAQAAALGWAYDTPGAVFYCEIPDSITTEAQAIAWHRANLAIGPAQDLGPTPWPSYLQIRSPYGRGLYTAPISGLVLGLTARRAVDAGGYQDAPAGRDWLLSPIARGYPEGVRGPFDNETLNAYGLIEVRRRGSDFYLWGDRIPGHRGRQWLHKTLSVGHIARTLLDNTDRLVFRRADRTTWIEARRQLRELFQAWYRLGWFSDEHGPALEDQVQIQVDEANNTSSTRAAGEVHASISFAIVDTAERVVFTLDPNGIKVSA